ncbi:MAG TPA: PAS domain-containing protein [Chthoniobacterales bacterium]
MQNLMAATNVGTLFLDTELRIKRFTPPIAALFNITKNDEGRPITDFTHRLDYSGFADDAQQILRDLTPIEREVAGCGSWFLNRLRLYRTADERIEGVVATFIDITERRTAEQKPQDQRRACSPIAARAFAPREKFAYCRPIHCAINFQRKRPEFRGG